MPYVIRYITTTLESTCAVTLRGIFENGRYFGDIVVRKYQFSFSIESTFDNSKIRQILESIRLLENIKHTDNKNEVDFWIGKHPIQSQKILFMHSVHDKLENVIQEKYDLLVTNLNQEFHPIISQKINDRSC